MYAFTSEYQVASFAVDIYEEGGYLRIPFAQLRGDTVKTFVRLSVDNRHNAHLSAARSAEKQMPEQTFTRSFVVHGHVPEQPERVLGDPSEAVRLKRAGGVRYDRV